MTIVYNLTYSVEGTQLTKEELKPFVAKCLGTTVDDFSKFEVRDDGAIEVQLRSAPLYQVTINLQVND